MEKQARKITAPLQELGRELIRKSIHLTIAFSPTIAQWSKPVVFTLFSLGILLYLHSELRRLQGKKMGWIATVTRLASRPTEQGFIWGPLTLGLGAFAALIYYPLPVATVAIYALAFGDGLASLAGRAWGRQTIFLGSDRTIIGSTVCFLAVLLTSFWIFQDLWMALATALVVTLLELLPLRNWDNLVIPLGTGLFVMQLPWG